MVQKNEGQCIFSENIVSLNTSKYLEITLEMRVGTTGTGTRHFPLHYPITYIIESEYRVQLSSFR